MKILVLGGTVFVGRHIVEAALRQGHEVELFNRGRSGPALFPELKRYVGDRAVDLASLRDGRWDAVIDTCGYQPEQVRAAAEFLRPRAGGYLFVSSVSVYRDWAPRYQDERSPLAEPAAPGAAAEGSYGPLKAACERAVLEVFKEKAFIIRPGLICGPHDSSDRFTYWPVRIARGGEILAPGRPERLVQLIDARDLARWAVSMARMGAGGVYNACGSPLTMKELLRQCADAAGTPARLTWVGEDFLSERGLEPYLDLPLWIPGVDDTFNSSAARSRGLFTRPLRETIRATLAWHGERPEPPKLKRGLSAEREAELLAAWRGRTP